MSLQMITWAAILVLQGAEGGVGEHGGKNEIRKQIFETNFAFRFIIGAKSSQQASENTTSSP
jgi:hypothetical protein